MTESNDEVPLYHSDDMSYKEFCQLMTENRPCRISGLTEQWRASNEWVVNSRVDVEKLEQLFAGCIVPVADCQRTEYGSQPKTDMSMKSYLDYWRKCERPDIDEECWANTKLENCLYLKDWHMQQSVPEFEAYEVPEYFSSDWLNEFWLSSDSNDDYRFVYIGPQGSWTPFHCDVFGSYSWSANVCGKKLWLFLPPGEEVYFKDNNGKLAPDITNVSNEALYPRLHECRQPLKVVQESGETIFVPSGWYHQVLNVKDTISINHNWFNGFNLECIVRQLDAAEAEVKKELSFMKTDEAFSDQVAVVLKAHHGMNRKDLQDILSFIARRRLENVEGRHAIFDLCQCSKFLEDNDLIDKISTLLSDMNEQRDVVSTSGILPR